jgi:hypothetical protein
MILHFGFSIQKNASIGPLSILLATTVSRTPSLFIQRHRQRHLLRRSQSNCFYFEYWRIDCVHLKRDCWCTNAPWKEWREYHMPAASMGCTG